MTIRSTRYGNPERPRLALVTPGADVPVDPKGAKTGSPAGEMLLSGDSKRRNEAPAQGIPRPRPKMYAADSPSPMADTIGAGIKAAVTGRDMGDAMDAVAGGDMPYDEPDRAKAMKRPKLKTKERYD